MATSSIYILVPGLRRPNESFFHGNQELLGLGRQIGHFHYSTITSTKKLSPYIHIQNIYLGLEYEFGPQRIIRFSCVRSSCFLCMHSPMNTRLYWIRRYVGNFVNIQKKFFKKLLFFYLQHFLSQKSRDTKLSELVSSKRGLLFVK